MGDVGALALGAALGTIAVIIRQEIVLFIMGGVFVAETLSVMIQSFTSSTPAASASSAWRRCTTTTSWRLEGEPGRSALLDHHHDAGPLRLSTLKLR